MDLMDLYEMNEYFIDKENKDGDFNGD